MSIIEKAYQNFKKRKDQTKVINGKLYYRIVWSDFFMLTGCENGYLSIVPSPDMPKKSNVIYMDENGNHFTFGGFHFLRFNGHIPDWYFKCGECCMNWQETHKIGKYLTII